MKALTKIPVSIITGFLGSGKTTLISQLIQSSLGKNLAIIVNEFGDMGFDGGILKNCAIPNCPSENIIELSNGCICCTVANDFIPTIEVLMALDPQPDHILIETSGLALPKPLLQAFDWPGIRSRITVDGMIALADAEAVACGQFAPSLSGIEAQRMADNQLDHATPLAEIFEDQIACADLILLTKPDLVSQAQKEKAKEVIMSVATRSLPILEVTGGYVDPRVILGLEAAAEDDIQARPSHHDGEPEHDHEDFESAVFNITEIESADHLATKIKRLADEQNVLRVKGYAAVAGKPMRLLVQAVGRRVRTQFDRMWISDEPRQGNLVVISLHDYMDKAAIQAILVG